MLGMNVHVDMVDMRTGEIYGRQSGNYAFNFSVKNDAGFIFLLKWIQSAVRGVRVAKKEDIQLRIHFTEEKAPSFMFGTDKEEFSRQLAKDNLCALIKDGLKHVT